MWNIHLFKTNLMLAENYKSFVYLSFALSGIHEMVEDACIYFSRSNVAFKKVS